MKKWQDDFRAEMSPYMNKGAYRNYTNLDLSDYNQLYFLNNFDRLVSIKIKYDPDNIFSSSQSIPLSVLIAELVLYYLPYAVPVITMSIILVLVYRRSRSNHLHQE